MVFECLGIRIVKKKEGRKEGREKERTWTDGVFRTASDTW